MDINAADRNDRSIEHRLKILVVDDDEMSRRLMRLLLIRDGHDVQVVANGVEALVAVKEQQFDIVFMDLQMPIMDGFEASRRIREWENGNVRTYIVALTASYLPEDGQRLFEAGMDNYISKPFEVEHIRHLLRFIARSDLFPSSENPSFEEARPISDAVLDFRRGIRQVGGELQTYKELLKDFIQELPNRVNNLERFFEEKNVPSLTREAHNLKGVSSNLGALELSQFAGKLEKQSIEGYTDQNQTLIQALRRAESNLRKTATDFLEKQEKIVASA